MTNLQEICLQESTRVEFLKRVNKTDYCWEWIGTVTSRGYGHFKKKGKLYRAHRLSFTLFKGPIPKDILVCHSCDNPKCVNPDHLWLGTGYDNAMDMVNKGRAVGNRVKHYSGDANSKTRLTSDKMKVIKGMIGTYTHKEIAKMFGVSKSAISYALKRS